MSQLKINYLNPKSLKKNPWNPNEVDPINQDKIVESLRTVKFFKPILCRELPNGDLEILGGEHRVDASVTLGLPEVPVINLGRITDAEAKKIGLLDNGRYGHDNHEKMAALLSDSDLGTAEELLSILAIDAAELSTYFEHETLSAADFAMLDEREDDAPREMNLAGAVSDIQTHAILRYKVTVEDAATINDLLAKVKSVQGFVDSDDLSNSGNALVHVLLGAS